MFKPSITSCHYTPPPLSWLFAYLLEQSNKNSISSVEPTDRTEQHIFQVKTTKPQKQRKEFKKFADKRVIHISSATTRQQMCPTRTVVKISQCASGN